MGKKKKDKGAISTLVDNINKEEISALLATLEPTTKIYIGGDSFRSKRGDTWYATYSVVVVVHKNGNKGCKVFGRSVRERDYDQKKNKPSMRLMTEVMKVVEVYQELEDILIDYETEIHLDINPKKEAVSNIVMQQAMGYVLGNLGIKPKIKPDSPAASFAADQYAFFRNRESQGNTGYNHD